MSRKFGAPVPILRSFDEARAREFWCDFLGFTVDWAHRFDDNAPLYMQLSRDACVIHVSEHFGDATPGSGIRVRIEDVAGFCAELNAKKYRHARPGYHDQTWGAREIIISDPFGNKVVFFEDLPGHET
jgi:uncharacterized glyoxalase superfamily protein PhnB